MKEVNIGGINTPMTATAFTPILYRRIFHQDYLSEVSKLRALKKKAVTEYTDDEMDLAMRANEMTPQLAFCMAKQAELHDINKLVALTIEDYYTWLDLFPSNAFTNKVSIARILAIWLGNDDAKVEAKNEPSQETESSLQP